MAFSENLSYGKIGEDRIAKWIRSRGSSVLPVYEKQIDEGKGPQLFTVSGGLIAPDLLVLTGTSVSWVEAKRKTRFTWYRRGGYWTTGIDLRHYSDYLKVAETHPFPFWLMFLHECAEPWEKDLEVGCPDECPTGLFGNSITYLRNNESHRHANWGRSGMVYWNCKSLRLLAPLDVTGGNDQCEKSTRS